MASRRSPKVQLGFLALVLGGAALLVRLRVPEASEPAAALALLRAVRDQVWAVPAFLAAYMGLTSLFAPATVFHLAAGAAWGFRWGLLLSLIAFHLSSNVQFLLARRLGPKWVEGWSGGPNLRRISVMLEREGLRAAMLVRLLPLPNLAVNLAAGLSPIRWRDFALGTAVGTLPVITVYTWFAAALVEGAAGARREALVHTLLGGVGVVAVAVLTRWLGRRKLRPGHAGAEGQRTTPT